jgi:hypothetical protein
LGLSIGDCRLGIAEWGLAISSRQSAIQSALGSVNRQSPIDNPIGNRQCRSAIANRQSVNRQSALGNRQSD